MYFIIFAVSKVIHSQSFFLVYEVISLACLACLWCESTRMFECAFFSLYSTLYAAWATQFLLFFHVMFMQFVTPLQVNYQSKLGRDGGSFSLDILRKLLPRIAYYESVLQFCSDGIMLY